MGYIKFIIGQLIVLISSAVILSGCSTVEDLPEGYQLVESAHGSYQYLLPQDWEKTGFNCYEGDIGRAFEEIYPAAEITEEYCSSFVYVSSGDIVSREIEKHLYYNGQLVGCYIVRDIINTNLDKQWRSTSFKFSTSRGVESLTVNIEKEKYDRGQVWIIINSINIK